MAKKTHIEWTEMTWNPVTGCDKVSPGCKNCYAERMSGRLKLMGSPRYKNGFKVTLQKDLVDLPKSWKAPRIVFVNSMSDLFHKDVPDSFILDVFKVMNECPQHQFQVLTKRPERLKKLADKVTWTENIWMGVSVESQPFVFRARLLSEVPAKSGSCPSNPCSERFPISILIKSTGSLSAANPALGREWSKRNGLSLFISSARKEGPVLLQAMGRNTEAPDGPGIVR